ncbi:MAG: hypothetical protein ABI697_05780 [Devosia sp.]
MSRISPEQRAEARSARQRMALRARQRGMGKVVSYAVQSALEFPLIWLLKALPVDVASAFGGWVGRSLIARLTDREVVERTLRVPFPAISADEVTAIIAALSDHLGRVVGETAHLDAFAGIGNRRISIVGAEHMAALSGQPVLFVGGHFGNWELYAIAIRALGFDGASAVQHPSNPAIAEWIACERFRNGFSEQVGAGEGVYRGLRRTLKAGRSAAIMVDQSVVNGIAVPFFGRETMTNLIPARLARELGVPVVLVGNRRLAGAQFELSFQPPLRVVPTADRAADERALTTRINAFYEAEILRVPGHWLWGHPRWDEAPRTPGTNRELEE